LLPMNVKPDQLVIY